MTNAIQRKAPIKVKDKIVSCPPKGESVTFMHPRVYLKLSSESITTCPYCETPYIRDTNDNT